MNNEENTLLFLLSFLPLASNAVFVIGPSADVAALSLLLLLDLLLSLKPSPKIVVKLPDLLRLIGDSGLMTEEGVVSPPPRLKRLANECFLDTEQGDGVRESLTAMDVWCLVGLGDAEGVPDIERGGASGPPFRFNVAGGRSALRFSSSRCT